MRKITVKTGKRKTTVPRRVIRKAVAKVYAEIWAREAEAKEAAKKK